MTQAPTLNGVVIGQAERATRALLDVLLRDTGISFVNWVSLNVLATGGDLPPEALVDQLTTGLRITAAEARQSIDEIERMDLVAGEATLRLTPDGQAMYQRISSGIADVSSRLYGGLPEEDLIVARRVLETVTARAREEAAKVSGAAN